MPGTIHTLATHPLTGGRQITHEAVFGNENGLIQDRQLLLFTESSESEVSDFARWSTKRSQSPAVRRIGAMPVDRGFYITFFDESGHNVADQFMLPEPAHNDTAIVDEFGTPTLVRAYDREIAQRFEEFLSPDRELSLGRKVYSPLHPALRGNAPYHIQNLSSLQKISEQTDIPVKELIARYRPNIVVDMPEEPAGSELGWRMLRIGGADFVIHKTTVRCEVPDQDPLTGRSDQSVAKVSQINRDLPKRLSGGRARPILGLYAVPLTGRTSHHYAVNDDVAVTSRTQI